MPRLTLRVDFGPDARLGPGKVRLLEAIAEHGSISAAGRALGMSYRRAWLLVAELNRLFATPLVDAAPGGPGGGGASLTERGEEVLVLYRRIEAGAARAVARDLAALTRGRRSR
jgi:molybdate transport system regulatory protein